MSAFQVLRCSTCVMLWSLDLSPCWSLLGIHSFYRTGDTAAVRSIAAETLPTKPKLLELASPQKSLADFFNMHYWEALAICWPLALVCSLLLTGDKRWQLEPLTPDGNNCWISHHSTEWLCSAKRRCSHCTTILQKNRTRTFFWRLLYSYFDSHSVLIYLVC